MNTTYLLAGHQTNETVNVTSSHDATYSLTEVVIIGTVAAILSIVTVVGNIMVMISFKIDKQLQIVSNYFLFSLAIADFAIGLISMPLFTVYTLLGYWPLGPMVCDTWLALDYLASNASVLNLLIISFDRYFSVTRPLTYRAKRTTKRVACMISCAWGISLLLWPPWIYSWPYIEGERTVPDRECYIQFIETNHYITFGTAIAAFYVPVTVMCALYWRIWRETEKRKKDLPNLQAGKKDSSSKRSNSSDEQNNAACSTVDLEEWRRPRSESSTGADNDSVYMHSSVCVDTHRRRTVPTYPRRAGVFSGLYRIRAWCIAWWHSGREDSDTEEESPSEQGQGCITPVSLDTPLQSSVSRDPYSTPGTGGVTSSYSHHGGHPHHLHGHAGGLVHHANVTPTRLGPRDTRSLPAQSSSATGGGRSSVASGGGGSGAPSPGGGRSVSTDSVYTILIRLPDSTPSATGGGAGAGATGGGVGASRGASGGGDVDAPSIRMIPEDEPLTRLRDEYGGVGMQSLAPGPQGVGGATSLNHHHHHPQAMMNRRPSAMPDIRIPLNAKIIPKQLAGGKTMLANATKNQGKKKKKTQEKKADKKAAKTLSAILLTFIITWTPYNILVLLKPVTSNTYRIPPQLWDFFYALCYINSTINPMCYALCNASFRRTYLRILKCKWHSRQRTAMNRGYYN